MRGTVLHAPGDIRLEQRPEPAIVEPTDAIIRLSATCICGSDLWPYRGVDTTVGTMPMGHEYVGIVEEVGSAVTTIKPGQFVVGSFFASDNTCEICRAGYQSSCVHRELMGAIGTQAEFARIPLADGTLVATPEVPPDDLIPSFLAASDVLGTGWFGAAAAEVGPRQDRRRRGRRSSRPARRAGLQAAGRGADHRDEPTRGATEAGARLRRHRHRRRTRCRGRGRDQGPHRRAGRTLGHRGRRDA